MAVRYRIEVRSEAKRQLAALPGPTRRRIDAKIQALAEDPRPVGAKKLVGSGELWRIRVGNYRVLYAIEDNVLVVIVVKIGHRQHVYRR